MGCWDARRAQFHEMISIFRLCSSCFADNVFSEQGGLMQSLHSLGMREATHPISLRLAPCHIEQLKARDGFCPGNLIREKPFGRCS
jgi:hypothetical protein